MYEKQIRLFKWGYILNDNENETENEKRWHRYDINRHRLRHGCKYTKYKMCLTIMMVICIKQQLSNIWRSIYEKVKQHWGWVEKSVACKEKHVVLRFRTS